MTARTASNLVVIAFKQKSAEAKVRPDRQEEAPATAWYKKKEKNTAWKGRSDPDLRRVRAI